MVGGPGLTPGILAAALLLGVAVAAAQEPTARLGGGMVVLGETVDLVVSHEGELQGSGPDLGPLIGDFEVVQTRYETHRRTRDGGPIIVHEWTIELSPRYAGRVVIPPLAVDGRPTPAIPLEVRRTAPVTVHDPRELMLEVQVEPREVWVGAQITLTVRLYRAVDLIEGYLDDPRPASAALVRLGRDRTFTTSRNDIRYRVLERRYALFPDASGPFEVPALVFEGEVAEAGPGDLDIARIFGRGRPVALRTEPVPVQVRPRPAGFPGTDWLPAETLRLEESWSRPPGRVSLGEPLTRTVRLEVVGQRGEQLPAVEMLPAPGLGVYPERPEVSTGSDGERVQGLREERIALLPTAAGEINLPAIRVPWMEIATGRMRVAELPARILLVTSAGPAPPEPPSATGDGPALSDPIRRWPVAVAGLLLLGLLHLRLRREPQAAPGRASPPSRWAARHAVRAGCQAGDARAAARALLAWGAATYPEAPPRSLPALARRLCDSGLAVELERLDLHLYTLADTPWDGRGLAAAARRGLVRPRRRRKPAPALPPLYPDR